MFQGLVLEQIDGPFSLNRSGAEEKVLGGQDISGTQRNSPDNGRLKFFKKGVSTSLTLVWSFSYHLFIGY